MEEVTSNGKNGGEVQVHWKRLKNKKIDKKIYKQKLQI